jgi:hypothetical protein
VGNLVSGTAMSNPKTYFNASPFFTTMNNNKLIPLGLIMSQVFGFQMLFLIF